MPRMRRALGIAIAAIIPGLMVVLQLLEDGWVAIADCAGGDDDVEEVGDEVAVGDEVGDEDEVGDKVVVGDTEDEIKLSTALPTVVAASGTSIDAKTSGGPFSYGASPLVVDLKMGVVESAAVDKSEGLPIDDRSAYGASCDEVNVGIGRDGVDVKSSSRIWRVLGIAITSIIPGLRVVLLLGDGDEDGVGDEVLVGDADDEIKSTGAFAKVLNLIIDVANELIVGVGEL
ncbi:hypothetical protein BDQ17DRAFT_1435547 [Cyathus striatus]|nr:hypothetical protein BDQ17DRAFT_1435547 [Cyathus striatus]